MQAKITIIDALIAEMHRTDTEFVWAGETAVLLAAYNNHRGSIRHPAEQIAAVMRAVSRSPLFELETYVTGKDVRMRRNVSHPVYYLKEHPPISTFVAPRGHTFIAYAKVA